MSFKALARLVFLLLAVANSFRALACQCPQTQLTLAETEKYEIIFRGTVAKAKTCDEGFGEAIFKIDELFKGAVADSFLVLFECGECATGFKAGEEWIIYTRFKQISNAKMDWCSRSRKFFTHDKEDFFKVNSGVDYFDELNFLRKNLGLHRVLVQKENAAGNRNLLPQKNEFIIILLCSLAGIVLFYFLFRKLFR
jgi:hypothetical protein